MSHAAVILTGMAVLSLLCSYMGYIIGVYIGEGRSSDRSAQAEESARDAEV